MIKPTNEATSKQELDKEKKTMEDYKVKRKYDSVYSLQNSLPHLLLQLVLQKFVSNDHKLQLGVVYATQAFCNELNFPRGS